MKRILLVVTVLAALSASLFAQKNDGTCAAFPCVVASVTLAAQSQPLAATAVWTPIVDGTYRVSIYGSTSAGSKGGSWQIWTAWTDTHGFKKTPYGLLQNSSSPTATYIMRVIAGQPIQYQTVAYPNINKVGTMTYDLNIVVEQLQ